MSGFDRYGDSSFDHRDRSGREDRDRSGFFSNERDVRGFGRGSESELAGQERDDRRIAGRDRDRERTFRDNQPGRTSRDSAFAGPDRVARDEPRRGSRDRDRSTYGNDDNRRLPIDETEQLIASNKVEGTPVYGREGERLGTIYNFMVDKYSGRVTYAVMSYGGFLGVGQRYYPVPWQILNYDTREGGYRIDMDYRDLERAPSFGREDEPRFNRDYGRKVHNYYGLDY